MCIKLVNFLCNKVCVSNHSSQDFTVMLYFKHQQHIPFGDIHIFCLEVKKNIYK